MIIKNASISFKNYLSHMIISILHLSDIHFKSAHNVVLNRKDKIFDITKNQIKGKDHLFILTSGDIAFSGKQEEYKIAKDFYTDLYQLYDKYDNQQANFLFVPGNHDCLFDYNNEEVRKIILQQFTEKGLEELTENLIAICCKPQDNYFDFVKDINGVTNNIATYVFQHPLLQIVTFSLNDFTIKFSLYNTSWDSSLHEKLGTLKFPIDYINEKIEPTPNSLSISVLHHPFNWQKPENSKEFRQALMYTSEVIISGHEHYSQVSLFNDFSNEFESIHIESSALQDTDNEKISNFNLINIDTDLSALQILKYEYDNNISNYKLLSEGEWRKINKEKKLKSRNYQLKKSFIHELENPGASFVHSTADEIKLIDIYVPPFFQNIDLDPVKKSRLMTFTHSESALSFDENIKKDFYKIILGDDYSGKTASLKYFYLKYYNKGFYPIYIPSQRITGVDQEKLKKIIENQFKQQYDELDETFENIDFEKIIILIDDFHTLETIKAKMVLINTIKRLFSKVIITGSELMMYDTYLDKKNKPIDIYADFEWYLIRELNPSLRNQLINKWYRLGQEYMDNKERNEFLKKVDFATSNIDTIIGKNFIPPYPIYILTILQGLETGDSESNSNKQHAYYYEQLITQSFKRVLSDKNDIGFYMTLCKELFFYLFNEKIRFQPITKEHFFSFLDHHKKEYSISKLNYEGVLKTLIDSRVLKVDSDKNILIAYKYLYYFFVARYLSDNMDESKVQEIIDLMSDRVYRDEYSNIIVFLTHLVRNKYIIQKLIEKSRDIYNFLPPAQLEDDITFINELQQTIPEQILKHIDVEDLREKELRQADEMQELEKQTENLSFSDTYDLNEDISTINVLSQLTRALRTINILGQLTKRYWGELKGDQKFDLAEETLLLGLRTLAFNFTLISGDTNQLIEYVKNIVEKKFINDNLSDEQLKNISKNLIFNLCHSASFSIIKRIADAVGSEKLSDTYEGIIEKYPFNSTLITHTAIKLEHFSGFPNHDLDVLNKKNEKNPLAFATIQNLLINHMYSYDIGFEKRQQICQKWNIKMEEQRAIASASQVRK